MEFGLAEGQGFEPWIPVTRDNRLAGGRTRPLCDPSDCNALYAYRLDALKVRLVTEGESDSN
jgi:hypothetical protein